MAGAGGIEPTLTVLETVVLPLYDAPMITLNFRATQAYQFLLDVSSFGVKP